MLQNPLAGVLPDDQADLILIMLVSVPLSYLLSLTYSKYLFLAMTMSLTIGFQSILFPNDRWVLWIQQQVVYLLVVLSPRRIVGHIVILECFVALVALHARRLYLSYGENYFDITGIFMMQLFNYISMAYNYQNGAKPLETLSLSQIKRRIIQKPKYINYLGYVNFLPACLVGPVYQYTDFEQYLNRTGDYSSIPNTLSPTLKEGGVFLLALIYYGATSIFPLSRVTEPVFEEYTLGYRLLYCVLAITHIELKYVSAWSLGMMSMRASGLTYNPSSNLKAEDGSIIKYDFGRIEVSNMTKFYLEPNFKVKVDNWNISVQQALKRYIYENIYPPDPSKPKDPKKHKALQLRAQIGTVMVSALWHGLYPGYFISFANWVFFILTVNEVYRQKKREGSAVHSFNARHPTLYKIMENIISTYAMTYFGVPFHLMTWSKIWIFLQYTAFVSYIVLYIVFFLVVQVGIFSRKRDTAPPPSESIESKKID